MKIGIVCDNYKVERYVMELAKAGLILEVSGHPTMNTTAIIGL